VLENQKKKKANEKSSIISQTAKKLKKFQNTIRYFSTFQITCGQVSFQQIYISLILQQRK